MKYEEYRELRKLVQYDARRRGFVATSCQGKHRFPSFSAAGETIGPRLRRVAKAYHCPACNGWHIGGVQSGRQARLAREGVCA